MDLDQSILASIKQMLGLTDDITAFDAELIVHINSNFTTLSQLHVGSIDSGFMITGYQETWHCFLADSRLLPMVKEYIYLKVRMIFDTPASSVVADQFNNRIAEIEWRLNIQAERLAALEEENSDEDYVEPTDEEPSEEEPVDDGEGGAEP